MINIIHPEIEKYLDTLLPARPPIFHEMEERYQGETFPAIGPQVGMLLHLFARAIKAKNILELGSGFGYSGLWLAQALPADGKIILTDLRPDYKRDAENYFKKIGLEKLLDFRLGPALEILKNESGPFDLIFNDVDKEDYPEIIELAYPRLRQSGLLITDNTLWYGHVMTEDPDRTTSGVLKHNRILAEHPGFLTVQIPLRDGLSISFKL